MELMEAIEKRRAIREYEQKPVPMEDIRLMIRAATWAPSGYNSQPWRFILVQDPQVKARMVDEVHKKLNEISQWPGARGKEAVIKRLFIGSTVFKEAPVAIAVLAGDYKAPVDKILDEEGLSFEEKFRLRAMPGLQSVSAAIQNLHLAAASLGYGTCWGTGCLLASEGLERVLEVKAGWRLVAVVPVGIPKRWPDPPKRKAVEDVLEVR